MTFDKAAWQRNRKKQFKEMGYPVRGVPTSPERLAELRAKFTDEYFERQIERLAEGLAEAMYEGD